MHYLNDFLSFPRSLFPVTVGFNLLYNSVMKPNPPPPSPFPLTKCLFKEGVEMWLLLIASHTGTGEA